LAARPAARKKTSGGARRRREKKDKRPRPDMEDLMKISGKSPAPMQNVDSAKLGRAEGAEKKPGKGAVAPEDLASSAKVDVSERARDVSKAKALATPADSIDDAKVARLQKLIDEGNYKIDADAIAERMLDEHMKMPT
jgi:negative regulator of flagellin synthesis FlgM